MFFGSFVSHASSFLRPVAPRPLRRFIATMSALTPAKVPPGQVSTLHALRLRTARPPPTCSAPSLARRHAAGGLPRPSLSKAGRSFAPRRDARPKRPGVGQPGRLRLFGMVSGGVVPGFPQVGGLTSGTGRIEFVILSLGPSPPAALHPASRRRSCSRFHPRGARVAGTCTPLTMCARARTHLLPVGEGTG